MDLHPGRRSPPSTSSSSHLTFPHPDPSVATARHIDFLLHQVSLVSLEESQRREVQHPPTTVQLMSWIRSQKKCVGSLQLAQRSLESANMAAIVIFRTKIALKRNFRSQCSALSIGPARTPPHEPHYSALSFDFDALAVGIHSGQMPAPMHRLNLQAPVQSVGTCSICRYRLNLQARDQSAGTGSIYRHGLNLQARFERRM